MKIKKLDANLLFIFLVYTTLRLFIKFKAYWIWGDEAKYLACAKSFPFNRMFNHSYYDFHPVFYPYMIRFFCFFFKDHIAAIAVSFFSSLALFFVIYRLLVFLNLNKRLIYAALIYLAFNNVLIAFSKIPFRYELFVCLFYLSFYMYLKGITTLKFRYLALASLFGGLAFMTSDMMPFVLLPALSGAFFIFDFKAHDKTVVQLKKIMPVLLIVLMYICCVILPKFIIYSTHTYYAGGMEGRIEKVSDFGLRQLIHPVYFPNAFAIWGKSQLTVDLIPSHIINKIFSVIGLQKYDDAFFNWTIFILIMIAVLKMLFNLRALNRYKVDLYLLIVSIGMLCPVIYTGFISRNAIAAIPLLAYFLAKGSGIVFRVESKNTILGKKIFKYFAIFLIIIFTGFILKKNRYFIFTLERIEQADKAAAALKGLPKDGILAEGLIVDALVYNSDKRIVTLPRSPDPGPAKEQTDLSIDAFDLNYAVISEFWKIELDTLAYPAVEYIRNSPEKFRLITTVHERYDTGIRSNAIRDNDTFYIYEIIRK